MMSGPADTLNLNAAIDRAATLLATDPAQSEALARRVISMAPGDPRPRLILGSARRRRGDPAGARAILEPLARAHPRAANTLYELGASLAALGQLGEAQAALRQALSVNRELPEAWRALGELLFRVGDAAGSERAFAEHARTAVRDPALKPAAEALFAGRLDEAEALLRQRVLGGGEAPATLHLLAQVFLRKRRYGEAETLLARAVELEPGLDGARFDLANALFQQQKAPTAVAQAEALLARDPADPAYRNLLAACLGLIGDFERVIALYEGLLKTYERQPRIWLNYGHALRTVGRRDDAVAAYRRCLALAPEIGDAWWSLANLKVSAFSEDDLAAMTAQAARDDLAPDDQLQLNYALGKAHEDAGNYAASFAHYARGAAIRRGEAPYDSVAVAANVRRTIETYTDEQFATRHGGGSSAPDPIFIIGLPRAGSTLVEQILSSHSLVEGTMELPDIGFIAKGLGEPYPEVVAGLDFGRLGELGDRYIETTRIHRKLARPFFIDKMPNNFHHLGLICLTLPRAKIIDARRHPLGSGFSAFKQHFNQGQDFSYDLADIGLYYRDYVELMAHFDAVLPGRVHRVIYEDMVEDTEGQVRRLLDYCGLPFEDACLRFYENDRAVRTVSSEQVRRPIFRQGLEQWRNYEPWLEPLKLALGPVLETWRG
jgi:tetratricopeptide (TPR) repeat protein